MTDPLLNDLSRHLHERIGKVIDDYLERIKWSGKTYSRDQVAEHLAITVLSCAATACKAKTSTTLDEFIKAAYAAYQSQ
jgi:hypothetical protein